LATALAQFTMQGGAGLYRADGCRDAEQPYTSEVWWW